MTRAGDVEHVPGTGNLTSGRAGLIGRAVEHHKGANVMRRFSRLSSRRKLVVLAAAFAAALGIATAVQASIPDSNGVVHACYNTSLAHGNPTGALRVIDTAKINGHCASWEAPVDLAS